MTIENIDINELPTYVDAALEGDEDILLFYDKKVEVKTVKDACTNIVNKISIAYSDSYIRGVKVDGAEIGYFVFDDELLISFGINKDYRNKETLTEFWGKITNELGGTFNCLLYSYNERAIGYLKKCGMSVIFDNVTILRFENNLN